MPRKRGKNPKRGHERPILKKTTLGSTPCGLTNWFSARQLDDHVEHGHVREVDGVWGRQDSEGVVVGVRGVGQASLVTQLRNLKMIKEPNFKKLGGGIAQR